MGREVAKRISDFYEIYSDEHVDEYLSGWLRSSDAQGFEEARNSDQAETPPEIKKRMRKYGLFL